MLRLKVSVLAGVLLAMAVRAPALRGNPTSPPSTTFNFSGSSVFNMGFSTFGPPSSPNVLAGASSTVGALVFGVSGPADNTGGTSGGGDTGGSQQTPEPSTMLLSFLG